ncbi:MAG: DNA polymerase I [Ignavibacteriales bacterium]|nr:DNA polymerase I [Ignavibacteriales bacterium]MCB9209820.1 DNA polymerase I [Ignavibacteriales bacterium]MCB9218976.1 DNA polymerase I [Ignavibacteriales bacterium]
MPGKKFVIIDALAMAYKAYFAFINRPLRTSKGEPTSAVYGFLIQLIRVIEETKPDYLAVAYDSKEKTFRHEIYDGYKASRSAMPDDMIPQIARIKELVETFNIPQYIKPGFEADDIIGTAVKIAESKMLDSYAVTPDKDYVQLITKKVNLIKAGKSTDDLIITDFNKAVEDYGFEPKYMVDYLALVGDSSDDIPGVAGIGPKSAQPLIEQFGTLESIYENIDKIEKKGIVTKLEVNKDNAFLSKKLATIVHDVNIDFNFEDKIKQPDFEKLQQLFTDLEFKNLLPRVKKIYLNDETESISDADTLENDLNKFDKGKVKYHLIKTFDGAESLASLLSKSSEFVFDTETDSLDVLNVNLAGASFCLKKGEAYFVTINPFKESNSLFENNLQDRLPIDDFVKIFKPVFENSSIKKICQNGKYDLGVLKSNGINVQGFEFDTMLASYLIDPDQKHGMDVLAEKYLNYEPIHLKDLFDVKKDPSLVFEVEPQKLNEYASEDADITYQLYKKLSKELTENNLEDIAYNIEFPLVTVLESMERSGVRLDIDGLNEFSKELDKMINEYTSKIFNLADEEFNINSTKQLQYVLFEKLKLKPTKKTKTGFSTDAKSLEMLQGEHEIVDSLLNYRQITKLKSTYADALPKLVNPKTGKIHTTYNQTVASTGRLSSLNPNLQNIPIRTELGREIRKAFIPTDDNFLILSADYSQIELRIMAHLSGDESMIKAFSDGQDIHRSTAALVFQVDPDNVTPDMRRKAKEVNFGILYGIGAFGLASRLGITRTYAQEVIDTYFNTFKNIKGMMDSFVETAQKKGFAETINGRRRFLPNINSKNRVVRQFEERVAINMPIQGTAADMIKMAMISIHNELEERKTKTKMILQVHDELLFDIHKDEVDELTPLIVKKMENAMKLKVPIIVESGIGKNWLEAH